MQQRMPANFDFPAYTTKGPQLFNNSCAPMVAKGFSAYKGVIYYALN